MNDNSTGMSISNTISELAKKKLKYCLNMQIGTFELSAFDDMVKIISDISVDTDENDFARVLTGIIKKDIFFSLKDITISIDNGIAKLKASIGGSAEKNLIKEFLSGLRLKIPKIGVVIDGAIIHEAVKFGVASDLISPIRGKIASSLSDEIFKKIGSKISIQLNELKLKYKGDRGVFQVSAIMDVSGNDFKTLISFAKGKANEIIDKIVETEYSLITDIIIKSLAISIFSNNSKCIATVKEEILINCNKT